jgi:hypothetical protein
MFGYVRPSLARLEEEDRRRFAAVYCGLCRTLDRLYGLAARFILNYDFTFLAVLLSQPEAGEILCRPCIAHPFRARDYFPGNAALETAADCSVILTWWQLRDGAADHRGPAAVKYRAAGGALAGAYRRARERRADFDRSCGELLEELAALERERCPSMDRTADTFARLLRSAGGEVEDPMRRRVTEELLYHLGRWIYLVDAADDLAEDFASGNYNPLLCRFSLEEGCLTEEAREALVLSLDHSIRRMAAAYELWDFGVWSPIIQSTVYEGLFCVGKAVLEGTFQAGELSWHRTGRNKERL